MSGETENQVSSWTVDTLKVHLERIIAANDRRYEDRYTGQVTAVNAALSAQEKAVNAALVAAEKAVNVAENNAAEWRKGANEWRQAMTDREAKFVGASEFSLLKERLDRAEGKDVQRERSVDTRQSSHSNIIAIVGVVAGIIGAAIGFFLKGGS